MASGGAIAAERRSHDSRVLAPLLALSLLLHVAALWIAGRLPRSTAPSARKPMELVMVEVQKPPPVAVTKPQVAQVPVARLRPVPRPPRRPLPPPPNDPPPAAQPPKPAPLVVGLTLSSTTTAGDFAAPVGNTLYGKTAPTAEDPASVKAYSARHYVPSYQVDRSPEPTEEIYADYPDAVRKDAIEGSVLLSVLIDDTGKVAEVKVVKGLDRRLDALALKTLEKSHWRPAILGGQAVATRITYSFRFELTR